MDVTRLITDPVTAEDPNVLLTKLRAAAKGALEAWDDPELSDSVTVNEAEMAEAFLQLDDWMARGGFSPAAWQSTDD